MEPMQLASNWEKLGIVGLLIVGLGLTVWAVFKLIQYMLRKHEETTAALREEIGRREKMIEAHQDSIVRMTEAATAGHQRALDVIERNSKALDGVTQVLAGCALRQKQQP